MSKRSYVCLALAAALALSAPTSAPAFLQATQSEGVVGQNIGGVWLAVHQVMPEFRVRFDSEVGLPFKVGEISEELEVLTGGYLDGVEISEIINAKAASDHGVFKGDVITRINGRDITSQKDVEEVISTDVRAYLVTIRRPRLKFSDVALVKIKYEPKMGEEDGQSVIEGENIRVIFVDAELPFAKTVDRLRSKNELWAVSEAELKDLRAHWHELPRNERAPFSGGKHRVVDDAEFDSALRSDPNAKGADFALISTLEGNPLMGGGQRIAVYGFRGVDPDKLQGSYVQATIAAAPFPISLEFKGTFAFHKISEYSDAEVAHRKAEAQKKAAKEEDWDEIKLAPDVPSESPKKEPAKEE